jgi:transcriptional regulator with XRE-family HTH domain
MQEVVRLAPLITARNGPQGSTGVITGHVLKLARKSAGLSQEALAELLQVSPDTIQGWESGRRRVPATQAEVLVGVRHELTAAGADSRLIAALGPALEADWLLGRTLEPDGRTHPLAAWVATRQVHDLLVWVLVGQRPLWVPDTVANGRQVSVSGGPALGAAEQRTAFARLRDLAERVNGHRVADLQLRRQAAFLAGFDPAPDTGVWLAYLPESNPSRAEWSPQWVAARSRVITIAARGNPEPLRWFIDHYLAGDDRLESAQLAWNAHYYGEVGEPQYSDVFMVSELPAWRGEKLLAWLAGRLNAECGYVDLVAHTLWALFASRHDLAVTTAAEKILDRSAPLMESEALSDRSRRELGEIRYLLRSLNPKGS